MVMLALSFSIIGVDVETTRINNILYQRYKTPYTNNSNILPKPTPTSPSILAAQILWVDLDHQYAIAKSGGIYEDG